MLHLEAEKATYDLSNQVDADVVADRLAALAGPAGDTVAGLLIQCSLAATRLLKGSAAEAVGFARRGLADDRLLDGGAGASFPFMAALTAFSLADDQDEADAVFARALQHARQRGPTAARASLQNAYDGAGRCGSVLLAQQARTELVATGGRPRRQQLTGLQALTASERRVCELAAGALTNSQIAQQLFVTRSTVEKHLGHAYDKLGVTSRQSLIALLANQ